MATSVYLSNDRIQAVTGAMSRGSVSVSKACEKSIQEGCFLNGMITDEALLLGQIEEFWHENNLPKKDIFLLVYGTQYMIKTLQLPKMKDAEILKILPNEFAENGSLENAVCDYRILSEEKGMLTLLAVMAEKTFVKSFVDLFGKLGIRLSGFGPARDAEIKLLGFLPQMKEETCILQVSNGINVSSILWGKGQYMYASDTRIYSDPGTESWAIEMARNTNAILQFYAGLNRLSPIEKIYVGGFTNEEKQVYGEASRNYCSLEAEYLDGKSVVKASPEVFNEYLGTIGSLIQEKKNINLYDQYWKSSKERQGRIGLLKCCILPAVVLACCLGLLAGMLAAGIKKQNELEELTAAMQDAAYQESFRQAQELNKNVNGLTHKLSSIKSVSESLATYPLVNASVINTISSCGQGAVTSEVQSYVAETGALELYAVADQVTDINRFIDNLKGSGLFEQIEYSGYGFMESEKLYNINVVCYLAPTAGR